MTLHGSKKFDEESEMLSISLMILGSDPNSLAIPSIILKRRLLMLSFHFGRKVGLSPLLIS